MGNRRVFCICLMAFVALAPACAFEEPDDAGQHSRRPGEGHNLDPLVTKPADMFVNQNPIDWRVFENYLGPFGNDVPLRYGQHDAAPDPGFGRNHILDAHGFVPPFSDIQQTIAVPGFCETTANRVVCNNPDIQLVVVFATHVDPRSSDGRPFGIITAFYYLPCLAADCDPLPQKMGPIKVLSSNMCLVARAGAGERPVVQVPCANFSDQVWILQYENAGNGPEGRAQIVNRDRNLCLVTRGTGETPAVVSTCNAGFPDQLWNIVRDPNTGYYQFRNQNSGLCLVVRTNSPETRAVQSTCGRQWADQLWLWEGWFN